MKNLFNLSEEEKNRIRGLHLTEAKDKRITSILSEQGLVIPRGKERLSITMFFGPGENTSNWTTWIIEPTHLRKNLEWGQELRALLNNGMAGDRPFIDIRGGTSATGSFEENKDVMADRIGTAFKELESALRIMKIKGSNDLPYSGEALRAKSRIDHKFDVIEPGSKLPTGEQVPTDPTDPFFDDKQYVTIILNPTKETPGYGSLADQFMKVTMEKTGTDEKAVYHILDQLRDSEDFREFNEELKRDYGMDFYGIACDVISVDLNPLWPGETEGPPELGGGDTTINAHLRRLGVEPISC